MSSPYFPRCALAACLAFALLSAGLSSQAAAPKPREATLGSGKAGGPLLTKAQLRNCMAQQERVRTQTDDTVKMQQTMATDRAEIDALAVALKAELEALDRTNQPAVEAYVARANARDKLIDSYQERTPVFNAKVDALKDEKASYATGCEGRRYLEDDYNELKVGK